MAEFKIPQLRRKKERGEPIVSITAYDLFTAHLARDAGVDFVLVGDSMANVLQGHSTTVPVSLEDVIYHTRIVVRALPDMLVIGDMPFGTFKVSADETVHNALALFKETGCGAVKMEGADESNLDATARLKRIGVPVMGHLGLLPQRVHATGGYRIQGRSEKSRQRLLAEAQALQDAGAFAVVLECVESRCAEAITRALKVPTIGIGSGPHTDGQILVIHDALGMHAEYLPSFARRFANLYADGVEALREYTGAVRARTFPGPGEYTMVPQKAADESDNEGAQTA
ncbi:3-methyl-2-oxobutanoate hydroxymethyltransferase [bacterium]|nr:3-methyl-2-oxobutanoate hydroxymethyltransferase [bacterium]